MTAKNKLPIVLMFSGQGSQYYHMGFTLYQSHTTFHTHLQQMDHLIHSQLGWSLIAKLFDDNISKAEPLDDLAVSHMAIFAIEVALARTLMTHGLQPTSVLGGKH